MKKTLSLCLVCIIAILLCACGAADKAVMSNEGSYGGYDKGYDYDSPSAVAPDAPTMDAPNKWDDFSDSSESLDSITSAELESLDSRKLIKNGNFILETLDFDKTIADIEALVSSLGGYVQNSNVSGTGAVTSGYVQSRKATYTFRLPVGGFGSFEASLATCGAVTSRNVYVDEVTEYYYDTEARLSSLQLQEQQLLTLMEKADKLDSVITLQKELSNVRYEIERLQGTLRRLDNQIAYSTINVTIREVQEPTVIKTPPKTLGQRISYAFNDTWDYIVESAENFVVFFLGNILLLVFWAAIIFVALLIIARRIRRRKASKLAPKNIQNSEENSDK